MEIEFEVINSTGVIKLNRPKSLNALNIEMAKQFSEKLNEWEIDENIDRVLLTGEGNHFCAGGDVKSLVLSKNINNLKQKFFETEYKLNYLISNFSKKYLTLWNGVVMGGGVGLSIYGNYRFANETCKFAMPETAIGFFIQLPTAKIDDCGGFITASKFSIPIMPKFEIAKLAPVYSCGKRFLFFALLTNSFISKCICFKLFNSTSLKTGVTSPSSIDTATAISDGCNLSSLLFAQIKLQLGFSCNAFEQAFIIKSLIEIFTPSAP